MYRYQDKEDKFFNLVRLFKKIYIERPSILIIGHRNSDIDAVTSCILLDIFMKKYLRVRNTLTIFPDGPSLKTKQLLKQLNIKYSYRSEITTDKLPQYKYAFFIDVGGEDVLGKIGLELMEIPSLTKILIDHHVKTNFISKFDIYLVDVGASSSLEIILNLISRFSSFEWLDYKILKLILIALYIETGFLRHASIEALLWLIYFMKLADINIGELQSYIKHDENFSAKMAYLKSLKRMKIYRGDNLILVITNVSAYMNQVSSLISRIGADIICVYSYKRNSCKIHIRIKENLIKNYKLDFIHDLIYDFSKEIYKCVKYGGHESLFNINYICKDCNMFINQFISRFTAYLEDKLKVKFVSVEV